MLRTYSMNAAVVYITFANGAYFVEYSLWVLRVLIKLEKSIKDPRGRNKILQIFLSVYLFPIIILSVSIFVYHCLSFWPIRTYQMQTYLCLSLILLTGSYFLFKIYMLKYIQFCCSEIVSHYASTYIFSLSTL